MKKKPPGVKTPPELKKRLDDFIPMHERPIAVQRYAQEIAALQSAGTGQQDKEVPMDQSDSHATLSMVGSSGRSSHSGTTHGTRAEAIAAMELEALQNYPHAIDSETPSDRDERQAGESILMSLPGTRTGDDEEEGEYTGEEHSDDRNEREGATSQATKTTKDAEPGGGEPKGRGVDG